MAKMEPTTRLIYSLKKSQNGEEGHQRELELQSERKKKKTLMRKTNNTKHLVRSTILKGDRPEMEELTRLGSGEFRNSRRSTLSTSTIMKRSKIKG